MDRTTVSVFQMLSVSCNACQVCMFIQNIIATTRRPLYSCSEVKIAFIIAHTRNNVVVLFGTLKVQSFILTEVRDCDLLIVVTSIMCAFFNIVGDQNKCASLAQHYHSTPHLTSHISVHRHTTAPVQLDCFKRIIFQP